MSELQPNLDVVQAVAASDNDGKFAIVLLYRYADADGSYTEWLNAVLPSLAEVGGRIVWAASGGAPIVGDLDRSWDIISVIEYPNRQAFLDQVQAREWAELERVRVQSMVANEIYACFPVIDALDHD